MTDYGNAKLPHPPAFDEAAHQWDLNYERNRRAAGLLLKAAIDGNGDLRDVGFHDIAVRPLGRSMLLELYYNLTDLAYRGALPLSLSREIKRVLESD